MPAPRRLPAEPVGVAAGALEREAPRQLRHERLAVRASTPATRRRRRAAAAPRRCRRSPRPRWRARRACRSSGRRRSRRSAAPRACPGRSGRAACRPPSRAGSRCSRRRSPARPRGSAAAGPAAAACASSFSTVPASLMRWKKKSLLRLLTTVPLPSKRQLLSGSEEARALGAHRHVRGGDRADVVLRERVAVAVAEVLPVLGQDVRNAVLGAADHDVVGACRRRRGDAESGRDRRTHADPDAREARRDCARTGDTARQWAPCSSATPRSCSTAPSTRCPSRSRAPIASRSTRCSGASTRSSPPPRSTSARAVVACFGPDAAPYRVELYAGYHAQRPPMPPELAHQWEKAPASTARSAGRSPRTTASRPTTCSAPTPRPRRGPAARR